MAIVAPLRRNQPFVLLWVSQALSLLGTSISTLAYPLHEPLRWPRWR